MFAIKATLEINSLVYLEISPIEVNGTYSPITERGVGSRFWPCTAQMGNCLLFLKSTRREPAKGSSCFYHFFIQSALGLLPYVWARPMHITYVGSALCRNCCNICVHGSEKKRSLPNLAALLTSANWAGKRPTVPSNVYHILKHAKKHKMCIPPIGM